MKEVYHCSPSELDEQDENVLSLHYDFLMKQREYDHIKLQREKQRSEQRKI